MPHAIRGLLLCFAFAIIYSCEEKTEKETEVFQTLFELTEGEASATYEQTIEFYIQLAREYAEINIQTIGDTDCGKPLHMVTYNSKGDFNFQKIGEERVIILINNGIHPGEPDGIDATMLLYRDLAAKKLSTPNNTVLVTIPVYNIGGALNRNSTSRANQNGPLSYGFRGNAQNYDLNRDFIKNDTKNAQTFAQIFHLVKPDIFIDNHVSNGADYQYTLTHLFTQHNKLGGRIGKFLHEEFAPAIESNLQATGWDITPYVNVFNRVPETGFSQFMDYPRYSTGYTTLWNTIGMMVETHMLKPYKDRVLGTYEFMKSVIEVSEEKGDRIKKIRQDEAERHKQWTHYPVGWDIDTTRTTTINFKGFEADTLLSEVTGFPRLKYDRNRPFNKSVTYQNYFKPSDSIKIPKAYVVKKGWYKIMDLMDLNDIRYQVLEKDTLLTLEQYTIKNYETRRNAYEGHYLHYNTEVALEQEQIACSEGDYIIPTDQAGIRYILETLEPQATDSFFNWNFFDAILQQKEGFSPYVFEDIAADLLEKNTSLRDSFLSKKSRDIAFSNNWYAQLSWIYKNSEYYETAHLKYPVYRAMNQVPE